MTYDDLRVALDKLSPEQLECDVTICQDNGEFFPAKLFITDEADVLDENHPYIAPVQFDLTVPVRIYPVRG